MLKNILHAHNNRDLQNFMALLNRFEEAKVTDIRFVRQRIQQHLDTVFNKRQQPDKVRFHKKLNDKLKHKCPSCSKGVLVGPYQVKELDETNLTVVRCSKKCGYSEVIR